MDILLFAEKIEQWSCLGTQHGLRGADINAPGHDLSQQPYFVENSKSPRIKLLFTVLLDLIICCTTKMGLLILCAVEGCNLHAIFAEKDPKDQGQGRQAREMACWRRDLSLPQVSHIQRCLQGPN